MGPIGVFDSGYGGLTVLRSMVKLLPGYDYIYLGDNARSPYGNRSFESVYRYTLQCVEWLLQQDCPLIILACNTASARVPIMPTLAPPYTRSIFLFTSALPRLVAWVLKISLFPGLEPQNTVIRFMLNYFCASFAIFLAR